MTTGWTKAAFTLAAALFASDGATAADKVSFAVPAIHTGFSYAYIAREKGYFKDEGLEVEIGVVGGGPATAALISGSLDYSSSPSSAMSAILKGAAIKVILVGQSRPIYTLWSFDPAVTGFEGLKGKTIAIGVRGGTDELALRMLLKQKGLPQDYFGYTPLGFGPVRVAAVTAGSQPYVTLTRIDAEALRSTGKLEKGRMIYDIARDVEMQVGGLATSEKTLINHPERTRKLLRALWKGTIYMMTQREGTIALMQKLLPKISREALERDYVGAVEDQDDDGVMSFQALAKELAVRGEVLDMPSDKIPPPQNIYDFSVIQGVIQELKSANWRPTS
jgi:ABC-type nitrate/sulfonate/bicarbonate transport system substrate-binding protein